MTDIIEQCGMIVNETAAPLQPGWWTPASVRTQEAIVRAVLAKFKELTAEPTSAMIDNALPRDPYNVEPLYRIIFKSMTEQKWKDIGI